MNTDRTALARGALLAGAVAFPVAGVASGILVLPVAAVPCLLAALALPRRSKARDVPDGTFDDLDVRVALDRLLVAVHGRVSPDVYAQVLRICQLILVATEARERESPHSADIDDYHLHQVAVAYLPGALDAYLAVPGIYAGMSAPGRKSPHENLLEQLNLIEGSVKRLTDGVVADETNRLEAHGRFLAEALGRSKLNLEETGADKAAPTAANMAPNDADAPAQSSAAGAAPHE